MCIKKTLEESAHSDRIVFMDHKSLVGNTVRDYKIERKLGQGGMGAVFLATHTRLDRKVAVKVLPDDLAKDETFIQRFEREARAVAQLHHPAIVQVHDMFEERGNYYLILEFLGGGSIRDLLAEEGPLPEWAAACLIRFAALGLHAAAEAGFVHRDIKPDNLLLTSNGEVKIADFGLVHMQAAGTTLTEVGTTVGTPAYMAPEQWEDVRTCDHRTDLYSLGCTLYELLAGEPPFLGPSVTNFMTHHITRAVPPLRAKRPDVSPGLEQVVMKLLSKKQNDRYSTGAELAEALDPFCEAPDSSPKIQQQAVQSEPIAAAATMPLATPQAINNPQIPVDVAANPLLARALQNQNPQVSQQPAPQQQVPQPQIPNPQVPQLQTQQPQIRQQQQQVTQQQPAAQPAPINQIPVKTVMPKSKKRAIGAAVFIIILLIIAFAPDIKMPSRRPTTPPSDYLAQAQKLEADGKLVECAWLLAGIGNTSGDLGEKAREKLKEIVANCSSKKPQEAALLYEAAIEFARHRETLPKVKDKMFKGAYAIVEGAQKNDPAGAAYLLNTIRDLAPKTLDVDNIIERLCKQALKKDANSKVALAQLAKIYLANGKVGRVISLLAPHEEKLSGTAAAGYLGEAYTVQGMYQKALPLLKSCSKKPFFDLLQAWKEFKDSTQYLFEEMLRKLQRRTLGNFDYARFSRLDEHGQRAMVYSRLAKEVFSDLHASVLFFRSKRLSQNFYRLNSLVKTKLIVAVGLPLLEKKKEAKIIESQLKELRTLFGQDLFFLYHGMVCHLLGRRNMTRARFERLLLRNDGVTIPVKLIIDSMQAIGAHELCKSLLEEAFTKTEDSKLQAIYATELADMSWDIKEKIDWLRRCQIKGPIKTRLELLYAREYVIDGERFEARNRYRRLYKLANDLEDKKEQGLVVFQAAVGIFELTGHESDLDFALAACDACFGEELPPAKEAAKVVRLCLSKALCELVASKFKGALVLEPLYLDHLKYVYPSEKALFQAIAKLKQRPRFKQAQKILEQTSVARATYGELLLLMQDDKGLANLLREHKEAIDGHKDDDFTAQFTVGQADDVRQEIAKDKHPNEFAYATARYVELALREEDKSQVTLAGAAFSRNNAGASTIAVDALLASSLPNLQKQFPNLKAFIDECRQLMPLRYAMALAATCNADLAQAIQKKKNTKKALSIWKRYKKHYPSRTSAWEWAICKSLEPQRAAKIKKGLLSKKAERQAKVRNRLNSTSPVVAVETYLRALMVGNALQGEKIFAEYRARGLPLPKMSL